VVACGDNEPAPLVAAPQELPLLTTLSDRPFNHNAEVTVAARQGRVVVASISLRLANADSFDLPAGNEFRKRVAVNVSTDGGRNFGPAIDPGFDTQGTAFADDTTDPVVRVASDGTFFLTIFRTGLMEGQGAVARSSDGVSWRTVFSRGIGDKPWAAVDNPNQQLFVAGGGGYWRIAFDGTLLQETLPVGLADLMIDAYAQGGHAFFATSERDTGVDKVARVLDWDGTAALPTVVETLDAGPDADLTTVQAWSHGPLPNGSWSIRVRRESGHGILVLRTKIAGVVAENTLTSPDANAFIPAAAMDDHGRLHVIWYDSSQASGRLLYAYSVGTAPFTDGFVSPVVIDDNAAPGNGWWPDSTSADPSYRRLREYVGIAIDGGIVHVAWTHAPEAPSRVWVTRISPPRP
jgi:hypothetical protein